MESVKDIVNELAVATPIPPTLDDSMVITIDNE